MYERELFTNTVLYNTREPDYSGSLKYASANSGGIRKSESDRRGPLAQLVRAAGS